MGFFSTTSHNTVAPTGFADKTATGDASQKGFAVPPTTLAVDNPLTDDDKDPAIDWKRGTKVQVQQHPTRAYDPYSLQNIIIKPHTLGEVVPSRGQKAVHRDRLTVMLETTDNGDGRIVEIEAKDLIKKGGLFNHLG